MDIGPGRTDAPVPGAGRAPGPRDRIGRFFGVHDPWERQGSLTWSDVLLGTAVLVFSMVALELSRSTGVLEEFDRPAWAQWLVAGVGAAVLVGRRRWPLTAAAAAALHMVVVTMTMPEVALQLSMQVVYFFAIFSGVAWARSRRDMLVVMGGVVLVMFVWIAWGFAVGVGIDEFRREWERDGSASFGVVSPVVALVVHTALMNAVFFGSAILGGQVAWRSARQRVRLAEQAELLRVQAGSLRRRAVLEERLRIARELHDVVAHHVSVIGIHAGAGRRVLGRDPDAAGTAFAQIERSSREAVSQMRGLLGTLRTLDGPDVPAAPGNGRAPEPSLADLPALVADGRTPAVSTSYRLVEDRPGAAEDVPPPIALSIYRTGQEALANVHRHSTATRVDVVVRVQDAAGYVEIEVVDDGRPRPGTSGSGLGQLGIRERAASHRGQVEIGPRSVGGYRVRVRLPLALAGSTVARVPA